MASEGLEAALERAVAYKEAGADFIFAEAVHELQQYKSFSDATQLPILANITEFGQTPLFTREELSKVDVSIILYPLSAFRAANKAAENVYQHIRQDGTQAAVIPQMQTREELYRSINYYAYENRLDQLFNSKHDDRNK
ncbi:Methylisocitrate lyase [compost metagenome]